MLLLSISEYLMEIDSRQKTFHYTIENVRQEREKGYHIYPSLFISL
jgi:hypothetical protein